MLKSAENFGRQSIHAGFVLLMYYTPPRVLEQAGEAWHHIELMKRLFLVSTLMLVFTIAGFVRAADEEPSFGAGSTPPPEVLEFLQ
jgi:hypothetical protein